MIAVVVLYWILSLNNENELKGLDCHRSVSFSASCGEPTVSLCWGVNVPIQGTPWVPCKMSKHFVPECDLYTNCTRCKSHDRIWGQGNTALHRADWIYMEVANHAPQTSVRRAAADVGHTLPPINCQVHIAHYTLHTVHFTLHAANFTFDNSQSAQCTMQMQVLGNWSILCRIIIRRQWVQ